jgi:hypothetical protein
MLDAAPRAHLYGEIGEGADASRMIREGRFKMIWYPTGNVRQLFDIEADPQECRDLAPAQPEVLERLTGLLLAELHGSDLDWVDGGRLIGLPDRPAGPRVNRSLSSQRGPHWPTQPHNNLPQLLTSA